MEDDARLRLDYDQTVALLHDLTDTRFRLLALVPTIAGAAVGFLTGGRDAVELLALGLLGFVATFGILVYELRAGEIKAGLTVRARSLESTLLPHGPLVRRSERRLFGVVEATQRRSVALVYGAALAAWAYVIAWGTLKVFSLSHARGFGVVVGVIVGLAFVREIERIERQPAEAPAAAPQT